MSQAEIGNLRVRLGIDTAEFANGVRAVQGSLASLATSLKAFAAGAAATKLFDMTVGAIKAVAEIGDVAESIGVSAEQFQAFNKMALASGTSTDVLTRGLQSLAEQSVDTGSKLAQLFEANGLTVKGKDTNQIIREFMDLVKNAASPTEQLAIITGVLGDKVGRQLVEAFREGAAGADEATKQMVASGNYHTNAEVQRLQDLETQYNTATDMIATYWQKMIVGIVQVGDQLVSSGAFTGLQDAINRVAETALNAYTAFWSVGEMARTALQNIADPQGLEVGLKRWDSAFEHIRMQAEDTQEKIDKLYNPRITATPGDVQHMLDGIDGGSKKKAKTTILPPVNPPKVVPPGTIEDIYGAGEAVSALKENFQEAIDGAGLFSDSLLAIGDTITSSFSNALSGLITGTMSVQDAFKSMAQSIVQTLTNLAAQLAVNAGLKILMAALGGGGGAGFNIGGMTFGGLYANGGTLSAGQWGIAGEAGPEVIRGPASITPFDKLGRGGSPQMNVTVINNSSAQVKTSKGQDGSLRVFIEEAMADLVLRGGNKVDAALARGYGLRRAGR